MREATNHIAVLFNNTKTIAETDDMMI